MVWTVFERALVKVHDPWVRWVEPSDVEPSYSLIALLGSAVPCILVTPDQLCERFVNSMSAGAILPTSSLVMVPTP